MKINSVPIIFGKDVQCLIERFDSKILTRFHNEIDRIKDISGIWQSNKFKKQRFTIRKEPKQMYIRVGEFPKKKGKEKKADVLRVNKR